MLLATGGMGQLYRNTTNPETATADGVGLAVRAGAEVSDLEFVQFHPTALYMKKAPPLLLSERLREEGAYLRNFELDRFMGKYHPLGERAPRDLVLRAIVHEMEVSRAKDPFVYLDLTHLKAAMVQKHFARIYETCMAHNVDITEDVIPVRPAAHYSMGGVRADLDGKTNVAGLYAAGEVAATGVHGASPLSSNALLEASGIWSSSREGDARGKKVTLGNRRRTQGRVLERPGRCRDGRTDSPDSGFDVEGSRDCAHASRNEKAIKSLEEMTPKVAHPKTRRAYEASHLHTAALLTARSAAAREESRGSHYRMDAPDHDDKKFLKHSVVRGGGDKVVFLF